MAWKTDLAHDSNHYVENGKPLCSAMSASRFNPSWMDASEAKFYCRRCKGALNRRKPQRKAA